MAAGFAVLGRIEARIPRVARSGATTAAIGGSIVLVQVLLLLGLESPWAFSVRFDPAILAEVLRLTRASDTIMDLKGETVFRDRPPLHARVSSPSSACESGPSRTRSPSS